MPGSVARLFAGMLAGVVLVAPAPARPRPAEQSAATATAVASADAAAPTRARKTSPYRPEKLTYKAKNYYVASWGIDRLKVNHTASGNLIRFSFRITEPAKAAVLTDKNATPYLFGQRSRALLSIPAMEKIGPLRQSGAAKAGQEYWMTFSNKGNLVRRGDRVNVVIGRFHADGLVVE